VRLPSFIFSILTFPILFLLLKKISPGKIALSISLLTTFLLALSPWHVLFGRTTFECNVALFFLLTGIYFFYKGLDKPIWFLFSSVMFAIAIPAYHSQRFVTPAVLLFLGVRYRHKLFSKNSLRFTLIGLAIGLVISLPTLFVATTPGFLARAAGLNIFSHQKLPAGFIEDYQGPFGGLVNGSWFLSSWEFTSLYTSYFSPRSMFVLGDSGPRSSFPELATFYLWQFPFYLYGLYLLLKRKELGELRFLTLILLLITPIPAAITRDPYITIRALPLVIPQLVVVSLGMLGFWEKIRYRVFQVGIISIFVVLVIYSLGKLYSSAIVLNEHFRGYNWDYGWEEVVKVVKGELDPSLPKVVDNSRFEPYSQFLFFLKYDPEKYQKENQEVLLSEYYTNMNRNKTKKIGNIVTRPISWEKDPLVEQYLIGDGLSISRQQIDEHKLVLVKEILYPDRNVAFRIVKTQP